MLTRRSCLIRAAVGTAGLAGCSVLRAQRPVRIIIVGAGMCGLYAAHLLRQQGADVTVLEAQERLGGRNWTLRRGDDVPDIDGSRQRCEFSPGQYLNAGPWRIWPEHRRVLALARHLELALEAEPAQAMGLAWRPQNGMDQLPLGLARSMPGLIRPGCPVRQIVCHGQSGLRGVAVGFGALEALAWMEADAVLLTVPLHVVNTIQLLGAEWPFTPEDMETADAIKIGIELPDLPGLRQSKPFSIGIDDRRQVLWPGGGKPRQRIAVVYGNRAALQHEASGPRTEQIAWARACLHAPATQPALAIQWSRLPWQRAAVARWTAGLEMPPVNETVFLASDGLSSLNGWQEGALSSAEAAVARLLRR